MSTDDEIKQHLPTFIQAIFEIRDRLADQVAEGVLRSRNITVGTSWVTMEFGWVSLEIYNDGDDDVYIRMGDMASPLPWDNNEAPLKNNESLRLDLKAKKYAIGPRREGGPPLVCFICQTGTANLRVFQFS